MISEKEIKEEISNNKTVSTKIAFREYQQINELVEDGLYLNSADFLREAIRRQLREQNEIILRDIPYEQQKIEVSNYMKAHLEADAIEIAEELYLDAFEVNKILLELQKEGKVKEI